MRFGKESGERGTELRVWQERADRPLIQNGAGQHGGRNAASQRKESPSRLARPAGQTTAPNVMLVRSPPTLRNPRSSGAISGNFADWDVFCTGSQTGGGDLVGTSLMQHERVGWGLAAPPSHTTGRTVPDPAVHGEHLRLRCKRAPSPA